MNFMDWFRSLTKPAEVFKEEKKNASLVNAIKNVGVAGLIAGVIFGFILGVIMLLFASVTASVFQNIGVNIVGLLSVLVVAVIILYPIPTVFFF